MSLVTRGVCNTLDTMKIDSRAGWGVAEHAERRMPLGKHCQAMPQRQLLFVASCEVLDVRLVRPSAHSAESLYDIPRRSTTEHLLSKGY